MRSIHVFLAMSFLLASPCVQAQDAEPAPVSDEQEHTDVGELDLRPRADDEWEFTLAPYLWAISLRSEVEGGPISATSETCFTDLLNNLEGAAQLRFEARKRRWGLFFDGTYLKLGEDARARVGPFRLRGLGVDVDITQAWLDFGAFYRFGKPGCAFDLMAGGRYSHHSIDVSIAFLNRDRSSDWVAPVIGGRFHFDLSDRWLFSLKLDAGGFGVGDAADLSWGVTGLVGYRASERVTFGFGYRFYEIEYSDSSLDIELQYHGPMVGMAFSF